MRAVHGEDNTLEMRVRRIAHSMGYRYSLHKKNLPGKPDLVFSSRKKIILVNGCFWHAHRCKRGRKAPATNQEYWTRKREGNVVRDRRNVAALRRLGWEVLIVWECQTKDFVKLGTRIAFF